MKSSAMNYLEKVGANFKEKGISVASEVRFGSAAEEIINYADEIKADLVAISTHGRSGIGRWIFGSNAARIMHRGNTPLLMVRT